MSTLDCITDGNLRAFLLGELPERVTDGQPASVAPLAWTDAAVLLALVAQAHYIEAVPVPSASGLPVSGRGNALAAAAGHGGSTMPRPEDGGERA